MKINLQKYVCETVETLVVISNWRVRVRLQLPPKIHQVHAEYVLVKYVSNLPWVMFLEMTSLSCHRLIKIVEVEIDGAAFYVKRQKSKSCHC